jgi:hypothetical protein
MRTRIGLLCAALILAAAGPATAGGAKWQAFGDAEAVKVSPGNWAIALMSDMSSDVPYGGIAYQPKKDLTFADLKRLSTDFNGAYGGGSPRFQINVELPDGSVKNIFVYLGDPTSFVGQTDGWESTGNLIDSTDQRWDTSQLVAGTQVNDYEGALAIAGDLPVVGIQLVVDGGWFFTDGVQQVLVDNIRVNGDILKGKGFQK